MHNFDISKLYTMELMLQLHNFWGHYFVHKRNTTKITKVVTLQETHKA